MPLERNKVTITLEDINPAFCNEGGKMCDFTARLRRLLKFAKRTLDLHCADVRHETPAVNVSPVDHLSDK